MWKMKRRKNKTKPHCFVEGSAQREQKRALLRLLLSSSILAGDRAYHITVPTTPLLKGNSPSESSPLLWFS